MGGGFPKLGVPSCGLHGKKYSFWESILRSPFLGELPYEDGARILCGDLWFLEGLHRS